MVEEAPENRQAEINPGKMVDLPHTEGRFGNKAI
jgi:hypothetical protein